MRILTENRPNGGKGSEPLRQTDGDGRTLYRLTARIIAGSVAETWADAKREWELSHIYFAEPDEAGTCLCGHSPIIEHCVLVNRPNGKTATVGNVCVTRFLGLGSEPIFR